eukprot:1584674-Ditylum_brightwellii.AAC.1
MEGCSQVQSTKGSKGTDLNGGNEAQANGVKCARLNARGFEQVNGLHYDGQNLSATVVNDTTIRIVFVMIILVVWTAELLGVKGTFLSGRFQNGKTLYMHVPQ